MKTMKRIISVILVALFCCGAVPSFVSAHTDSVFFEKRYESPISLPYSERITYSHKATESGTHTILDSRMYAFRAEEGAIVGVLFQSGTLSSGSQGSKSTVDATVYSDTGAKIAQTKTDGGADASHLEFIPAYTGVYYLTLSSRAAEAGEYSGTVSIRCAPKYQKNSINKFPHSYNYSKKTHKQATLSELFESDEYTRLGVDCAISIFEFSHEAGSIFSYKINTPDKSQSPEGKLFLRTDDVYTARASSQGASYLSGDAAELGYDGPSYLIIYGGGTFTLNADLLTHEKYVIYELDASFCGKLDVSNSSLMYDPQKISELIADFPFSDIENREAVFFKLSVEQSSVISYLCDRREHKYFSLVSDEKGLSPHSSYPLRQYGSYCSEVSPSKLCYNACVCDGSSAYLCYTGTDSYSYVELYTNRTHSASFSFEPKYKPGTELSPISISDIYNDSDKYTLLGIEDCAPDAVMISGYCMIGAKGERYYYPSSASLTVPDEHGTVKIYAVIASVYNSGTEKELCRYHSVYITDIVSDKGFLLPIIEDIAEYIADNPEKSTALIAVVAVLFLSGAVILVIVIKKKKAVAKNELIPEGNEQEEHISDKDDGGGV